MPHGTGIAPAILSARSTNKGERHEHCSAYDPDNWRHGGWFGLDRLRRNSCPDRSICHACGGTSSRPRTGTATCSGSNTGANTGTGSHARPGADACADTRTGTNASTHTYTGAYTNADTNADTCTCTDTDADACADTYTDKIGLEQAKHHSQT